MTFAPFSPFDTILGPSPTTLQVVLRSTCSETAAVQNAVVDGHVTIIINLEPVGPSAALGVRLVSTNFTLEIRDDDGKVVGWASTFIVVSGV